MIKSVDPFQQIDYLQQCLSSDKKPLGIFLGAGCPMSVKSDVVASLPLISDMQGITKAVCERLSANEDCSPLLEILKSHFLEDEKAEFNVEDMLSHVRALKSAAGKSSVRNLNLEQLEKLDSSICECINELTDKHLSSRGTPYHKLALWAGGTNRDSPVQFFTTNYDLLLEQALEDCEVPYFDGFVGSRRPFFDIQAIEEDSITPRWARLWKLHGSINWYQSDSTTVYRTMSKEPGLRRVIHPSHLKYEESRRMPYFAMIDKLRALLRRPSAVLVINGYSFRDGHLNRELVQGLQTNPTAAAFALLYGTLSGYETLSELAKMRRNLTVIADDGAFIGGERVNWVEREGGLSGNDMDDWVLWSSKDSVDNSSRYVAKVLLGDFAALGNFMQALAGHSPRS